MFQFLAFISIMVAAGLVGNWFLDEIKQAKAHGLPWYKPYLSTPGIIIMIAMTFPIVIRLIKQ